MELRESCKAFKTYQDERIIEVVLKKNRRSKQERPKVSISNNPEITEKILLRIKSRVFFETLRMLWRLYSLSWKNDNFYSRAEMTAFERS